MITSKGIKGKNGTKNIKCNKNQRVNALSFLLLHVYIMLNLKIILMIKILKESFPLKWDDFIIKKLIEFKK